MKESKLILAAGALLVVALFFAGCVVTNEEGTGPTEYWDAAYDYEFTVNTTEGSQGKLDKFTFEENIIDGDRLFTM